MRSAWEQAGDVEEANRRLRRARLGRAASTRIVARHIKPLEGVDRLRVLAPGFGRPRAARRRSDARRAGRREPPPRPAAGPRVHVADPPGRPARPPPAPTPEVVREVVTGIDAGTLEPDRGLIGRPGGLVTLDGVLALADGARESVRGSGGRTAISLGAVAPTAPGATRISISAATSGERNHATAIRITDSTGMLGATGTLRGDFALPAAAATSRSRRAASRPRRCAACRHDPAAGRRDHRRRHRGPPLGAGGAVRGARPRRPRGHAEARRREGGRPGLARRRARRGDRAGRARAHDAPRGRHGRRPARRRARGAPVPGPARARADPPRAGPRAARPRRGGARPRVRRPVQLAVRARGTGRGQLRGHARAALARLPDRRARHRLPPLLARRRRRDPRPAHDPHRQAGGGRLGRRLRRGGRGPQRPARAVPGHARVRGPAAGRARPRPPRSKAVDAVFGGGLADDASYFGFPFSAADATDPPGCYLAFQEPATAPSFGLDISSSMAAFPAKAADLAWTNAPQPASSSTPRRSPAARAFTDNDADLGANAADQAASTYQQPVRGRDPLPRPPGRA